MTTQVEPKATENVVPASTSEPTPDAFVTDEDIAKLEALKASNAELLVKVRNTLTELAEKDRQYGLEIDVAIGKQAAQFGQMASQGRWTGILPIRIARQLGVLPSGKTPEPPRPGVDVTPTLAVASGQAERAPRFQIILASGAVMGQKLHDRMFPTCNKSGKTSWMSTVAADAHLKKAHPDVVYTVK